MVAKSRWECLARRQVNGSGSDEKVRLRLAGRHLLEPASFNHLLDRSAAGRPNGSLAPPLSGRSALAAAAVPDRYSALVLTLAFGGLRFGEATALRRGDVTADGTLIRVERSVRYLAGEWVVGPPKTDAGRRAVALPAFVATTLAAHLDARVPPEDEALAFATRTGRYLSGANFGRTFRGAVERCHLPPVRVHELRHTGATLAATTGATTAELMRRLGHSSPDAALVYQHAAADRDAEIARALDALARGADVIPLRPPPPLPPSVHLA